MLDTILSIILLILLLSIIVIVHEGGHFIVAKIFGVYCEEFSIGMGPKIFSKKGKETTFSIRALPIGGFVAMAGEDDDKIETHVTKDLPKERTLKGIHPVKKIIIMLAGVTMNFILAIVVVAGILLYNGSYNVSGSATISAVVENSAAYGLLQDGDTIEKACVLNEDNCQTFKNYTEFSYFISAYDGNGPVRFYVDRNGEEIEVDVTPNYDTSEERYIFGINYSGYEQVPVNITNCLGYSVDYLWSVTKVIFNTLKNLLRGVGLSNLSGPVGIYDSTSKALTEGPIYYFNLLAILSLNIGIMNLLPLPVLDGGRVLITIIEMIIGKELNEKVSNIIMSISVVLLLLLMLFATYQDILRLF